MKEKWWPSDQYDQMSYIFIGAVVTLCAFACILIWIYHG